MTIQQEQIINELTINQRKLERTLMCVIKMTDNNERIIFCIKLSLCNFSQWYMKKTQDLSSEIQKNILA